MTFATAATAISRSRARTIAPFRASGYFARKAIVPKTTAAQVMAMAVTWEYRLGSLRQSADTGAYRPRLVRTTKTLVRTL